MKRENKKIGPVAEKILLLIEAGVILGFTHRPDQYFKVIKKAKREWDKINSKSMHASIRRLYKSKLINTKSSVDGTVSVTLTQKGKERMWRHHLNKITIEKPKHWDGKWRVVMFDVPENLKSSRDALAAQLKRIGFCHIQKSVFVFPYECKNEIDLIINGFILEQYVRFMTVEKIDIEKKLKKLFDLK